MLVVAAACSDAGPEATTLAPATTAPPVLTTAPPVPTTASAVPTTAPAVATTVAADQLAAFGRREVIVGTESWTVAVAATSQERARGLMFVTDLGDVDGMLFVFPSERDGGFWMKDTLIPLDIAFFRGDGTVVDVLSMVPCTEDPCPVYTPSGPYLFAVETSPGRFGDVGGELRLTVP